VKIKADQLLLSRCDERHDAASQISKIMTKCLKTLTKINDGGHSKVDLGDKATLMFYDEILPVLKRWERLGACSSHSRSFLLDILRRKIRDLHSARLPITS